MKALSAALTAVALLWSVPTVAQKRDLARLTCREFLDSGKENIALIVMWLHGYGTDSDDPPIIDFDKLKTDIDKISDYCNNNPTRSVFTAAQRSLEL